MTRKKRTNDRVDAMFYAFLREIERYPSPRRAVDQEHIVHRIWALRASASIFSRADRRWLERRLDEAADEYDLRELQNYTHAALGQKFHRFREQRPAIVTETARHVPSVAAEPPMWGERLLYFFLPKDQRDYIPGDLAEEFRTFILPRHGAAFARLWYWKQVGSSLWPILSSRIIKLAGFAWVGKAASWIFTKLGS